MSSSVSVTTLELLRGFPSVSVLHTVTRDFSKPFSLWYFDSLASSSSRYLSVSCTIRSFSDCDNFPSHHHTLSDRGTHSFAFFGVTLNSSMMFSSAFTVVQSSEPDCPQCLAWAVLTTTSSPSQPHLQFLSMTSRSRTPAKLQCSLPVSCLVTWHLFGLCTQPICPFGT